MPMDKPKEMSKCNHEPGSGHNHDHDHHHSHHSGHHHHHHVPKNYLGLAFSLNLVFAIIELFGGMATNSIAVLSDAVHDLGDALAIGMAWGLEVYSRRGANKTFSYGYRRFSTLGALLIGGILILSSIWIIVRAVPRLINPEPTSAEGMFFLAVLGIAVNGFAAYRVSKGTSLNERMVMWHLLEDVLGWVLVLVSSAAIYLWGWYQLDAGLAIVLAIWIVYNVFQNLRQTLQVFLQAVPSHLKLDQIEGAISGLKHIKNIHHTHLWSLDGEKHIFTAHIVLEKDLPLSEIEMVKREIKQKLTSWQIYESNIEFESFDQECAEPSHKN